MDISSIKLYATHEHPCSYLKNRSATTIFVDPLLNMNGRIYSELSDFGFRRSGSHVYRPNCRNCQACIPVRIPVDIFRPNRSQKRCEKRNQDVSMNIVSSIKTDEHYALYERYICLRHSDGDMFPPSREQYDDFLSSEWGVTRYLEFRLSGRLIAVAVSDRLDQGLSAIYTFFDPDEESRSLGVLAVMRQIDLARSLGLPYVYLGYWIKECEKMRYKNQYRPLQAYINNTWLTFD
ncbi:arginyltransferase [Saccharophagus sp. K07]|jgi:arginyl-tRNA--protein-N-Asp/Glu arginylyltransferase|uniref:arginyltransferase n=1 Tax=Saccharophagus sp. K07 TaxID=2283636 RepID=UPI00165216A1|nr:arginyltransferase [Saccharophagus sp. K07]MBC6904911.1 arginyltransferase [Saccharophagus sp. K07]